MYYGSGPLPAKCFAGRYTNDWTSVFYDKEHHIWKCRMDFLRTTFPGGDLVVSVLSLACSTVACVLVGLQWAQLPPFPFIQRWWPAFFSVASLISCCTCLYFVIKLTTACRAGDAVPHILRTFYIDMFTTKLVAGIASFVFAGAAMSFMASSSDNSLFVDGNFRDATSVPSENAGAVTTARESFHVLLAGLLGISIWSGASTVKGFLKVLVNAPEGKAR